MSTFIFWIVLLIMVVGAFGTLLPVIPGTPLIFLAALGYGFYEHFQKVTPLTLVILFLLMGISITVDYLAGVLGAKKSGASRAGTWGALLGGILGALFFSIPGLILGPFMGAVAGETMNGKQIQDSLRVGLGTVIGMAGGAFFKFVLAVTMIFVYLIKIV